MRVFFTLSLCDCVSLDSSILGKSVFLNDCVHSDKSKFGPTNQVKPK